MALRAIPNLFVVRPCDGAEAAQAWKLALSRKTGPTGLVLTRQKVPGLDRAALASAQGLHQGAYVLSEAQGGAAQVVLIATGSEVHVALAAQQQLFEKGVRARVVSMPCMELFRQQSEAYRAQVLPQGVPRVSVEAGVTFGWAEWTQGGASVGIDRFGASAPAEVNLEKLGLTPFRVAERALAALGR
jgi:transketolase